MPLVQVSLSQLTENSTNSIAKYIRLNLNMTLVIKMI